MSDPRRPTPDTSPSRRAFLSRASLAAAGAALLATGCDEKSKDAPASSASSSCEPSAEDKLADIKLISAAIRLEEQAVKVYTAAAGLPFISSDPIILSTAARFMGQHKDHSARLQALIKSLGAEPLDLSDVKAPDLPSDITDASKDDATRKTATLKFARDFEMSAAQTYFQFVTAQLRTPAARKVAADIMPAEAQHVAIYDMVLGADKPSPAGFLSEQS